MRNQIEVVEEVEQVVVGKAVGKVGMQEGLEVVIVTSFVAPIGVVLGIAAANVPIALATKIPVLIIVAMVYVPMGLLIEGIVATQGSNAAIAFHVFLLHIPVVISVPRRVRNVQPHFKPPKARIFLNSYMVASS